MAGTQTQTQKVETEKYYVEVVLPDNSISARPTALEESNVENEAREKAEAFGRKIVSVDNVSHVRRIGIDTTYIVEMTVEKKQEEKDADK